MIESCGSGVFIFVKIHLTKCIYITMSILHNFDH